MHNSNNKTKDEEKTTTTLIHFLPRTKSKLTVSAPKIYGLQQRNKRQERERNKEIKTKIKLHKVKRSQQTAHRTT